METILQKIKDGTIKNVNPSVVISNKSNTRALEVAKNYNINRVFIDDEGKKGSSWQYDKKIMDCLQENRVTPENGLICLAGFTRIISKEFVKKYRRCIMNIHPALLPSFPGLNAQRQALEFGSKITGCTIHFVDEGVDTGPIIIQAPVEVKENDLINSLADRILEQENRVYPQAVKFFVEGKLSIEGKRVKIRSKL